MNENENPIKEIIIEGERTKDIFIRIKEDVGKNTEKLPGTVFRIRKTMCEYVAVYKKCTSEDMDDEFIRKFTFSNESDFKDFMDKTIDMLEKIINELRKTA